MDVVIYLVECLERHGDFGEAEAWRRKWLAVARDRAGPDSVEFAGELTDLGLNLIRQRKWSDAEHAFRESLAVRQRKAPDEALTFNTQSLLGAVLLGGKKYAEAEAPLLKGYRGLKERETTIPPQVRARRLGEVADQLVELYSAANKPEEVKKWKAERAKYPSMHAAQTPP